MENSGDEYNASKIVVLEGVQGIRKRPAMYIGSTSTYGVVHLLFEALDNAIDEALAGYCKNITVHLYGTETGDICEVTDDGRGIPVDIMPKQNKSALEVIMTSLHSGGKFSQENYKTSGGLHGVGVTVINALSESLEVIVKRDGHIYRQTYERGLPTSQVEIIGDTDGRGTSIKFKPDPEIFKVPTFESSSIKDRMKYLGFLNKGIKLTFIDDRFGTHEEIVYYSEGGVTEFIADMNKGKNPITDILHVRKELEKNVVVEIALQYNDTYDERLASFVNNIQTPEGGTHVAGFHAALTRAIIGYASKSSKNSELKLNGDDAREGLTAIVNVLMPEPEFEGQTKEKLGSMQIKSYVDTTFYSFLSRYLEEHPGDARAIAEKVVSAAIARESARKAKELVRRKGVFEASILPGKLADCSDRNPAASEIFIVEGESAGGSSKQGRDKKFQAILPLRGKILNVEKATADRIFQNQEIRNIVTALGTGIAENFNHENARYHKIIIMSDADVDGSHIQTLLLTFFYRYMKKLVETGYVYVVQPPLYKITKGKEIIYCYSDAELADKTNKLGGNFGLQRYKGLGEMNPEQLWETTMNPEHRILKKIMIKDAERTDRLFTVLMGLDVVERRRFLEEHASEVKFLDV